MPVFSIRARACCIALAAGLLCARASPVFADSLASGGAYPHNWTVDLAADGSGLEIRTGSAKTIRIRDYVTARSDALFSYDSGSGIILWVSSGAAADRGQPIVVEVPSAMGAPIIVIDDFAGVAADSVDPAQSAKGEDLSFALVNGEEPGTPAGSLLISKDGAARLLKPEMLADPVEIADLKKAILREMVYFEMDSPEKILDMAQRLSSGGDALGQAIYGIYTLDNSRTAAEPAKTFLMKAALAGNPAAERTLGDIYSRTSEKAMLPFTYDSVYANPWPDPLLDRLFYELNTAPIRLDGELDEAFPADDALALSWYGKAATAGDTVSFLRLNLMRLDGRGVPDGDRRQAAKESGAALLVASIDTKIIRLAIRERRSFYRAYFLDTKYELLECATELCDEDFETLAGMASNRIALLRSDPVISDKTFALLVDQCGWNLRDAVEWNQKVPAERRGIKDAFEFCNQAVIETRHGLIPFD
jgi:hypothetical protein